jgi:hypothetical protein
MFGDDCVRDEFWVDIGTVVLIRVLDYVHIHVIYHVSEKVIQLRASNMGEFA